MNTALLRSLRERLDVTHEQYNLHFAGQMRTTRSTEMMRLMIEAAAAIKRDADRVQANGDAADKQALLDLCDERLGLYADELAAIEGAKADAGEDGVEAALLGTRANFVFHRYRRHFAGHSRSTRDVSLLREMRDGLISIREQMSQLKSRAGDESMDHDLRVIGEYVELFSSEEGEVKAARDAGTMDEQAGTLATLANDQFTLYRIHFAGQSRISRRPELLERMIGNLEQIRDRMQGLAAIGFHSEHNAANINVVGERLGAWQTELAEVRKVRAGTAMLEVVDALGTAIEPVLGAYNEHFAGQARESRNLDLLTALCDALIELEAQMERIGAVEHLTANERNLQMARDALVMFSKEWEAIAEAQGKG